MTLEELGNLGEAIGAVGVIFSLVYLAIQIRQQNKIAKAQFGNSLTQRLYDRYFQTSKDAEYAEFMALDWNSDDLSKVDVWRVQMALLTYLVDLFDVYDKYHPGLVDRSHLDTRMRTLKLGVMKTTLARRVWDVATQPRCGFRRLVRERDLRRQRPYAQAVRARGRNDEPNQHSSLSQ